MAEGETKEDKGEPMNEKEVAEIRRRFRQDKSNITHVRGCYVNERGEIVSEFNQSLALMTQEESEKFLSILKRTLSGSLGSNLIDIVFATQQVVDSPEHRRLMTLRDTELKDGEAVHAFFQNVIQSLTLEGNYLILLAHDTYDVPYRAKDGEQQRDASSEIYSYILCSVCPVKPTKPALSYFAHTNEFHNLGADWVVGAPELGFIFPAFDDRSANLYSALYYSRDTAVSHEGFVSTVFHTEVPMPAAAQRERFQSILGDALEEECNFEVLRTVHGKLNEMMELHKANQEPEPLAVSKHAVKRVLQTCGVSEDHMEVFEEKFDQEFGADASLNPQNIIDRKQFAVRIPDVSIQVKSERSDLLEMRMINGTKYILIRAEEDVEVNGVNIHIS